MEDEDIRDQEAEKRGRKGRDDAKVKLGKRRKDSDEDMSGASSEGEDISRNVRGSLGKSKRSMTPSQRKISVKKIIRDRTASRREGSQPKRLEYKPVPEEHVRLAKKINATFKNKIQKTEADRTISVKRPKHLYAGKMSNGKKDYR